MAERSIEEQVEDIAKKQLHALAIPYITKNDSVNSEIDQALRKSVSKSGGKGGNYPDMKLLLELPSRRALPVMIEVKGTKNALLKRSADGENWNLTKQGEPDCKAIQGYAVNGAIHYAEAVINYTESYDEALAIGINGWKDKNGKKLHFELGVYYLSRENLLLPKYVGDFSDLSFLQSESLDVLERKLESICLTPEEIERRAFTLENRIESVLKKLNQNMHDHLNIKAESRVQLVCGMIMAALGVKGKVAPLNIADLQGELGEYSNDGAKTLSKIKDFLANKQLPKEKEQTINSLFFQILNDKNYYLPLNGESPIKTVYAVVKDDIIPIFKSAKHLDFTGRLFNVLNSWIPLRPGDDKNDVVLTPRYVTELMARLCRVNKDSYVWDYAAGSGGFLISAMKLMVEDAEKTIKSEAEKREKLNHIKLYQLLGIELRPDIYMLAVLNMILMGDGSSHILNKNALTQYTGKYEQNIAREADEDFPANVFLLNPPYSAEGKGFIFVEKALAKMKTGYAAVLIQENAGSGNGLPYTRQLLAHNTLLASIKMPDKLFVGKASVQTAIYVFAVGRPHEAENLVKFIDFSIDGYTRTNRKKSSLQVNLRDTDDVQGRYAELCAIVLGQKKQSAYYTAENGCLIEDVISLKGNDWTYGQHHKVDTMPTEADFRKTVADYLSWKVSALMKEEGEKPDFL